MNLLFWHVFRLVETMVKEIRLYDWQVPHVDRLLQILTTSHGANDTSATGSGKTIVACSIAYQWNYPYVLVFGPKSIKRKWETTGKEYGINVIFMTYAKLRGKNNPYLRRVGTQIIATQAFLNLVRAGLLLVSDETSCLKNDSEQSRCFHVLVQALASMQSPSRVLLLSATPIDKPKQAESLLKSLGLITYNKLYEYEQDTRTYTLLGLQQIIDIATTVDPEKTAEIVPEYIDRKNAHRICYELYRQIIKDCVTSSTPPRDPMSTVQNGYYRMSSKDEQKLRDGVDKLKGAVKFQEGNVSLGTDKQSWGALTLAMQAIERAKRNTFIRLAERDLETDPQCKVVICYNYLDNIHKTAKKLQRFNPLVLTGETTNDDDRWSLITAFQEPSTRYRLFIMNTRVGATGIDLDDIDGNFPRKMYVVPTYNLIDIHQCTGRVDRANTKSIAEINLVYGQIGTSAIPVATLRRSALPISNGSPRSPSIQNLEQKIFDALAKKSEVVSSVLYSSEKIVFPGEYPTYIEP